MSITLYSHNQFPKTEWKGNLMATDMNESSTTEKMSKFQLSGTQTVLLFTGNWPVIYLNNPDNALLF